MLESFALGVPVVSSDLGGLPELVSEGVTGGSFLRSARALAAALTALVADPAAAHEMGRRAWELVATSFSPTSHLAGLDAAYGAAARGRATTGIGA